MRAFIKAEEFKCKVLLEYYHTHPRISRPTKRLSSWSIFCEEVEELLLVAAATASAAAVTRWSVPDVWLAPVTIAEETLTPSDPPADVGLCEPALIGLWIAEAEVVTGSFNVSATVVSTSSSFVR